MKYNIGDKIFWVESSCNYTKTQPCTMCFGKRFVSLILGDESKMKVACGFCERGIEGSTGYETSWEPNAVVKSGEVTGVSCRDSVKYEVGYKSIYEHEVYTESEAELVREAKFQEVKEQAEKWFKESFITCTKKQIWSAGYHRNCIKRDERSIEWHRLRLGMIKEKGKDDSL